ncbi:MAG: BadF/BadG/BcrA/BcrD ATPase family protein [Candidatus Kryptonium sp.]|nr:hypothetical protein [Candidatus Kryptonium sp.]MDW8108165.1 BadF/BadG/BcrA/BcrD ATPase family protein [Candidatus Kryptonium sp.]
MTKYLIGVDGGGTKTHGVIAEFDGQVIAEALGGSSNFQMLGVEPVSKLLIGLIYELINKAGCEVDDVKLVVLGLTGAGRQKDRDRIFNGLIEYASKENLKLPKLIIETDARIALEGAFAGGPGIILIAGTGSVMFAKDIEGKIHRIGGWGRFIGDEGSAFVIGREALRAVAKYVDGRGEKTILKDLIFEEFDLTDLMQIVSEIYSGKFDIGKVAPIVMKAVELGDEIARKILDNACEELFLHIKAMLNKAKFGKKVNLAFIGGVLQSDNYVSKRLKNMILSELPQINLIEPIHSPAYGAVIYGRNLIENKIAS